MEIETNGVMTDSGFCPFCNPEGSGTIIAESGMAFAIFDRYPVNPGHVLIIPKRHCADYFDLSTVERTSCWELLNLVKHVVDDKFRPDGFNIGINNLQAAGQTIPHVHIHLIPRYHGDVERPHGGIRGVIPGKKEY
jgi:diadenosine tetraphosphate (Ap4A) HIT family hydrolase